MSTRGYQNPYFHDPVNRPDYANWGYIILYLVVILGGVIGNGLFVYTVAKNKNLHRSSHFMLASLAVRDLLVAITVVPFVIDSQAVNLLRWHSGEVMCKLYAFLNYGTMATHSFILVFLCVLLYIWYKKPETLSAAEESGPGPSVGRKNRTHKWVIPLTWVLGLGLAIPAGALAWDAVNATTHTQMCSIWDGRGSHTSNYWVQLSMVIVGFIIPAAVLFFPVIALTMQLLGSREPRLEPPYSRTAWTAVFLFVVFLGTRAPAEIYTMMKMFQQSNFGFKVDSRYGTPYAVTAFETELTINCIMYVAVLLHPLIYFAFNPDYRTGVRTAWRSLYCNKDPATREREEEERRQRKLRQYPARNRATPAMRRNQEQLLQQPQPQIMPAGQPGVQYYPYPQPGQQFPPGMTQQQLLLAQQQQQQQLMPNQQFLDMSFERLSPQLPPVFEYEGLKYIDTARMEPKVGYSPEKTPPKTPETPHFRAKPFLPPMGSGPAAAPTGGYVSPSSPLGDIEMVDMSPQAKPDNFKVENLESSPGSTLRTRSRQANNKDDLDESVEMLTESPGNRNRRRNVTKESQETSPSTNGNGLLHTSRPTSPGDGRPQSRTSGVEIVITGRTRSRTDLCPDVPRSKFEHSV